MANWASTSYRIEGSKSDLERVYGMIDNFMSERRKPVEENASKEWEGNVVKALGATDEQVSKNYLRGFIQEYEMDGDTIRIKVEEAWGATDFRHVLAQLMPELTVYYIVEEPGCEVYATNDDGGRYFQKSFMWTLVSMATIRANTSRPKSRLWRMQLNYSTWKR